MISLFLHARRSTIESMVREVEFDKVKVYRSSVKIAVLLKVSNDLVGEYLCKTSEDRGKI